MNRHTWGRMLLFLAVVALLSLSATAAFADNSAPAKGQPVPIKLTLTVNTLQSGKVNLTVKATTAAGAPVANLPVNFAVVPEFFGTRPVDIEAKTTGDAGDAVVGYSPSWDGVHHFQVKFAGSDAYAEAEATADASLKSLLAPYTVAPPDHLSLRRDAGLGAMAVTALVWLLMVGVLVGTAHGIVKGKSCGGIQG